MFPIKIRHKQVKWYLALGIINVCLSIYVSILILIFWDKDMWNISCVKTLNIWLMGYLVSQALHLIRTVVIVMIWLRAKDPSFSQILAELFYGAWVFIGEAGWLIYGNTFIYSTEIKECNF